MWITKDETCQVATSCLDSSSNSMYNGYLDQQRQFKVPQQSNAFGDDEYCQDFDSINFCLDDFFVPTADNTSCAQTILQPIDKKMNHGEQHKVLSSLLASEPLMVKTESMDQSNVGWSNANAYSCQSPDSGVNLDLAFSPNSDYGSNCSVSPGMNDLDSPGSVASSFSSATSTDSGVLMSGGQNEVGFEIYHDLIMRHLVQDIKATCARLSISQDPKLWTPTDCRAWLTDMSAQYHLTQVPYDKLSMNGSTLCGMSLSQFNQCFPNGGETVHAQLQIWNSANEYCKRQSGNSNKPIVGSESMNHFMNNQNMGQQQYKITEEDLSGYMASQVANSFHMQQSANQFGFGQVTPTNNSGYSLSALLPSPGSCSDSGLSADLDSPVDTTNGTPAATNNNNNIHLWQFLRELLDQQDKYSHCVRWIDHSAGIFKIEDSHKLARLWGQRKNRPAMNYDKLSRSLRQYYKKNILKKTTRSQRLVYQFLHPYHMC